MENSTLKEASALLVHALQAEKGGFVARVAVSLAQAELAAQTAQVRRAFAKLANQAADNKDYERACAAPYSARESARLCTDRRALLSELVVHDVLAASGELFRMQPIVSFNIEPAADLEFADRTFDIKSAGQLSSRWHGAAHTGRARDDVMFLVNCGHHAKYCEVESFGGYVCVYFYMQEGAPVAADIFYITRSMVEGARKCEGTISSGADMSYYSLMLPFPDDRHVQGVDERLALLAA